MFISRKSQVTPGFSDFKLIPMYSEKQIKDSVIVLALNTLIEVNNIALETSKDADNVEYLTFINNTARLILEDMGQDIPSGVISKPKWTSIKNP